MKKTESSSKEMEISMMEKLAMGKDTCGCSCAHERFKRILPVCVFALVFLVVSLCNIYAVKHIQCFWCMGYAQSLAASTPFSVYAETITLAPSPIAFGLPHVYLMSFLIRIGIHAYYAYDLVLLFWIFLSMLCCYRICRFLSFDPVLSSVLPLFFLTLPAITIHHEYSALGIGYLLVPFYVWSAISLFRESEIKRKILPSLLLTAAIIIALFMDGYSFFMSMMLIGGVYLVFFNKKNWKSHLFFDPLVLCGACLAAYFLYTAFSGTNWGAYSRADYNIFQANILSYFLPGRDSLSILGGLFPWKSDFKASYSQHFLFCLSLLTVNLLLLPFNGRRLCRRPEYWLLWIMILGSVWLSLGPDIMLPSGKTVPSGNWLLYKIVPCLNVMRATARWGILVNILLVAMLYVSLIDSKMKKVVLAVVLVALYVLNNFPSPYYFRLMKKCNMLEHKMLTELNSDLDNKLVPGETVLFLPIRNHFSHLYFGSSHNVNTWNTGCDKNVSLLCKAYPPQIFPLAAKTNESRFISHLDPAVTAIQIIRILRETAVDTVIFDYNSVFPLAHSPYRDPLKKDAVAIESFLKHVPSITIDHSRHFSYYRLKKNKEEASRREEEKILNAFMKDRAFKVTESSCPITMDLLRSRMGFYRMEKNGCWSSGSAAFSIKIDERLLQVPDSIFRFSVTLHPFTRQRVEVWSRGRLVKSETLASLQVLSFFIDRGLLDEDGVVRLRFEFPDAKRPPVDLRHLGCFFHSVQVDQVLTKIPINDIREDSLRGFHPKDRTGRWASGSVAFDLSLRDGVKQDLQLVFTGHPLDSDQTARIRDCGLHELAVVSLQTGPNRVFIPKECVSPEGKLTLNFEFPNARIPDSRDSRILSFFFKELEIRPAFHKILSPGEQVDFNKPGMICQTGFSFVEPWGIWSNADICTLAFSLPENRKSETVHLQFKCQAFEKMSSVEIYCNEKRAAVWNISRRDACIYDLKLKIPLSERIVKLRFRQFDLASPCQLNNTNNDRRRLGMGFISMKYLP